MTTKNEQVDNAEVDEPVDVGAAVVSLDDATLDALMERIQDEGLELLGPDGVLTGFDVTDHEPDARCRAD